MTKDAHLLSCDWGTSSFRLRLANRHTAHVSAEYTSGAGAQVIASLHKSITKRRAAYLAVLQKGLHALGVANRPEIPLVVSGMACSTLGWHPLPYTPLPAHHNGAKLITADKRVQGRHVRFISGLRADCDVMRGEECELIGLFNNPKRHELAENCYVVLPGTHSKHVHLQHGRITEFVTHPTGELFAVLCKHSTLCAGKTSAFAVTAFCAGVRTANQLGLSAALFKTRAHSVLGQMRPEHSGDFLSGVLIGSEIASLPKTERVIIAAGPNLARRYRLAADLLRAKRHTLMIPPSEAAQAVVRGHVYLSQNL